MSHDQQPSWTRDSITPPGARPDHAPPPLWMLYGATAVCASIAVGAGMIASQMGDTVAAAVLKFIGGAAGLFGLVVLFLAVCSTLSPLGTTGAPGASRAPAPGTQITTVEPTSGPARPRGTPRRAA